MDSLTISSLVSYHARYRPHAPALHCGQWLSWQALDQRVNRLACALQAAGVRHGDRVVTVLTNCVEMIDIYWACARMGAVAVPLSPLLLEPGLRTLLADAKPVAIFHSSATRELTLAASDRLDCVRICTGNEYAAFIGAPLIGEEPSVQPVLEPALVQPDDLYNIMYTSGTTGLPKGIALTHRIRSHYASLLANAWRMHAGSRVLHTGALVFNGAFVTMLPALLTGASFILHPQFAPAAFVDTVEREKVTHTMLVPSQLAAILDSPGFDASRLASLEVLVSLGAPLPVAHKERLEALLPMRLHELYGLTEGFMTILDRADAVRKRGSVGIPPPFFSMRIVDEQGQDVPDGEVGEIAGRGPFLMQGYYQQPELTAKALQGGWLMTGDLGRVDEDGFLYLVDRKKDMIDTGGVKVYPHDVEEVIARHPQVAEAVVFGIPDEKWGETPVAAVTLRAGADIDADTLRAWVNERVGARYQRLSRLMVVAEFPRSVAGKILKRELRDPFWAGRDTAI
jgi:long-chain acyl-CoA synthetase